LPVDLDCATGIYRTAAHCQAVAPRRATGAYLANDGTCS
jgi:hypothetical protein